METYGIDTGTIAVAAIAFLVACIGITPRNWMRGPKRPEIKGEVLVQIRNELCDANASLQQLKSTVQHHQSALEKTATTLVSMRRSADDHASDVKSGVEGISDAVDAARTEAAARHEAMTKRIQTLGNTATDARENATNAYMTANGLRKQINLVADQIAGIPELRGAIERLQQSVAAIAEAMPKARSTPRSTSKADRPRAGNGRRRGNRRVDKAAAERTPRNAEAQPDRNGDTGDAGPPAQIEAAPQEKPPPAAAAPDASSTEAGEPGDDTAVTDGVSGGPKPEGAVRNPKALPRLPARPAPTPPATPPARLP